MFRFNSHVCLSAASRGSQRLPAAAEEPQGETGGSHERTEEEERGSGEGQRGGRQGEGSDAALHRSAEIQTAAHTGEVQKKKQIFLTLFTLWLKNLINIIYMIVGNFENEAVLKCS